MKVLVPVGIVIIMATYILFLAMFMLEVDTCKYDIEFNDGSKISAKTCYVIDGVYKITKCDGGRLYISVNEVKIVNIIKTNK